MGVRSMTKADIEYWRRREHHYGVGLLLLMTVYVLGAVDISWLNRITDVLLIGITVLMSQHPAVPSTLRVIALTAAGVSLVATVARAATDADGVPLLNSVTNTVVLAIAMVAVLLRLLRHVHVTISTVMGAVLVYALFGFTCAGVYESMQAIDSQPFFNQGPRPDSDFIYFSFIVLTTVGFGDLTPAGDLAKRLVAVEALMGQIFLVVLVSRLVSMWRVRPRRRLMAAGRDPDSDQESDPGEDPDQD